MGSFTGVDSKRKRYKRITLKILKRPCKKCFELILEGKKKHIALSCWSIIRYKCDSMEARQFSIKAWRVAGICKPRDRQEHFNKKQHVQCNLGKSHDGFKYLVRLHSHYVGSK